MPPKRRSAPSRQLSRSLPHLAIESVRPELDAGRFAPKRVVGDRIEVSADIFKDGHDLLAAHVRVRGPADAEWRTVPMTYDFNSDRWSADFVADAIGTWTFGVEAWTDRFATWRSELQKKVDAGYDVSSEVLEGAQLIDRAARKCRFGPVRTSLKHWVTLLRDSARHPTERAREAFDPALFSLIEEYLPADDLTAYDRVLAVRVDRERARFAAWYEMFPRSQGTTPGQHATFADAGPALRRIAGLGFDVVYLPPIHPVGQTGRKGRNNALSATPDDPGSPWAIGGPAGGHTAIEPRLGTLEDFDGFVQQAQTLGLEVALDYALQCSPDHPWLREHPEWFFVRPDGTIKYAENPPKKYQDIYPLNFWCEDRDALWQACLDILLFWIGHGVHTFRVDNPHTKPFAFWEWVIGEVHARHPGVIFLAEAFTRPKRMEYLAKLGFTQSYTYFTWRNTSAELRDYLTELTQGPAREYLRGNLFANTPDILHEYLQAGGRPAFRVRLLLAATLSPLYGIYSGFELGENEPLHAGSEEYLHSEKYEIRVRDWNAPGNINADIALVNRIRREHRALQLATNLSFHRSENDRMLFYLRSAVTDAGRDDLLVVVNLDPLHTQESMVHVPLDQLGLTPDAPYAVEDLLTGARYVWRGSRNYVRLDPRQQAGHVLRLVAGNW